ncbi:MAG: flippase-like domain-containing protein [Deltaproteobacteria bacterium]|nr:flippase-like domain-containing protein [Deltaproteobacteria bacterium]
MSGERRRLARGSKVLWGLFLGCVALAGVGAIGDFRRIGTVLGTFPPAYLAGALALASANYLLRWVRWETYLGRLGVRISRKRSLLVFGSGLGFSLSPGKAGELVKSYLLRDAFGTEVRRSAPAVLMERVSDLAGVLLLGLGGAAGYRYGWKLLGVGAGLLAGALFLAGSPLSARWMARLLPTRAEAFREAQRNVRALLSPWPATAGTVLALAAWFAECYAFWWVLRGVGSQVSLAAATFIYCLATLVGALSFLPGGLLATEGSMVAALTLLRVDAPSAAAATVIIRACTLWYAVALGATAIWLWGRHRKGEPMQADRGPNQGQGSPSGSNSGKS